MISTRTATMAVASTRDATSSFVLKLFQRIGCTRKSRLKESALQGQSLADGSPTGCHFTIDVSGVRQDGGRNRTTDDGITAQGRRRAVRGGEGDPGFAGAGRRRS